MLSDLRNTWAARYVGYEVAARPKVVTFKAVLTVADPGVSTFVGREILRPVEFLALVRTAACVRRHLSDWQRQHWPDPWE